MNNETQKYLDEVLDGLNGLPDSEKKEIVDEINSHIYEAVSNGEDLDSVLRKLGSPCDIAKSYSSIYTIENNKFDLKYLLKNFSFYLSTGVTSAFIVPTLFLLTWIFYITVPIVVVGSILGLFFDGISSFVFVGEKGLTGFPQLIAAVIISVLFVFLARACNRSLKKYIAKVSNSYRKLKLGV